MLHSLTREFARWQCWFYGWGTQTSSSLGDLPCLEDHQKISCWSQVSVHLLPGSWSQNSDWSIIIMQLLSWEMRKRQVLWLIQTTLHRDLPYAASPQIQGLGLNFLYNPTVSRTFGAQKVQWALVGNKAPFLPYYLSPHIVNNCHLLKAMHCANSCKAHYTLSIPQPVLHNTDTAHTWQQTAYLTIKAMHMS